MASGQSAATKRDDDGPHVDRVCFICADHHPRYWVVSECGHSICWLCSLRLRVLYGKTECPMCKADQQQAFMGPQAIEGSFEQHASKHSGTGAVCASTELGIVFGSEAIKREAEDLLRINCPFRGCKAHAFPSKADLRRHTSTAHSLLLCDICLAHKKVFPRELGLFSSGSLGKHHRAEHPTCKICGTHFFSDDELSEHYRDKHERCHICYRASPSSAPYYRDYYSLEAHFRRDHYLCPEKLCLELKFVVFPTEIEYKAHVAEVHLAHTKIQRSMQKSMTRIDSSFMYATRPTRGPSDEVPRPSPSATRPANPLPVTEPSPEARAAAHVDGSKLFFGDSISQLASRLASLSLYEQRNGELIDVLRRERLSQPAINGLKGLCQRYQDGGMLAPDLVNKVFAQLGVDRAKTILPLIIDLQLDEGKKINMTAALQTFLHKLEAFPPLPSAPLPAKTSFMATGSKKPLRLVANGGPPRPIRLVSNRAGLAVVDPVKNPLGLLLPASSLTSTAPKKPVGVRPGGFSLAAAAGSGHAVSVPSSAHAASTVAKPKTSGLILDEEQFPSLLESAGGAPASISGSSTNAFAAGSSEERAASFILGQSEATQPPYNLESANTGSRLKKKKKGQVVLRYG